MDLELTAGVYCQMGSVTSSSNPAQKLSSKGVMIMKQAQLLYGIIFSLVFSVSAHAIDENSRYQTYATMLCNSFLEYRASEDDVQVVTFVKGYLSALNFSLDDTYNLLGNTSFDDAMVWLDGYCGEHPSSTLNSALQMLLIELYPSRQRHAPG